MKSPCIGCEFEFADKNNPTCKECDRRVKYIALIENGGNIMTELQDIVGNEIETHESKIEEQQVVKPVQQEKSDTINHKASGTCVMDNCDFTANLIRGLCPKHYESWRQGRLKHPVFGIFTARKAKPKKPLLKKKKKTKDITPTPEITSEESTPPEVNKIEKTTVEDLLNQYPKIKKEVDFYADKHLVTPEFIIISIISARLSNQQDRN